MEVAVGMKKVLIVVLLVCGAFVLGRYALPYLCPVTVPGFMSHRLLLRHGYEIVSSSGDYALVRGSRPVILPVIDSYGVHGDLVVGHVTEQTSESKPGFFIVDTRTGDRWQALEKDAWMKILARYDITEEPGLIRPEGCSGWRARF